MVIKKVDPLPHRYRMPVWKRFWDWLLRKPTYTEQDFTRGDDDNFHKFTYFKDLYDKQTKFEILMGPGEDDDDPRVEVLQGVRVTGISLSCGDGPNPLDFDGSEYNGLSVDIAWEESRPIRTGWKTRILGE